MDDGAWRWLTGFESLFKGPKFGNMSGACPREGSTLDGDPQQNNNADENNPSPES